MAGGRWKYEQAEVQGMAAAQVAWESVGDIRVLTVPCNAEHPGGFVPPESADEESMMIVSPFTSWRLSHKRL